MRNLHVEIPRKIFHIISVLMLLLPLHLFGKYSITLIMSFMLIFFFPVSYFKIKNLFTAWFWKIIDFVEREKNIKYPGRQAFSLAAGFLLSSILFDEKCLQVSIITVAIYDGFSGICGILFGKHRFPNGRSIEGTAGGIIFNSIALSFIMPVYYSFLISALAGIIENISNSDRWYLDDNILIPLGTGFFSKLLNVPA